MPINGGPSQCMVGLGRPTMREAGAETSSPYPSPTVFGLARPSLRRWGVADQGHMRMGWVARLGRRGGFGGASRPGRVSAGFAPTEGWPEAFVAGNVNGGKDPESPAWFPDKGRTGGIVCVAGTLYARLNMQDGEWPDVNHAVIWCRHLGAIWETAAWASTKGAAGSWTSSVCAQPLSGQEGLAC